MRNLKTANDIADQFGVSISAVAKWARSGRVPASKFAGAWVFDPAAERQIKNMLGLTSRSRRTDYDVAPEARMAEFMPIADACAAVDRSEQQVRRWMKAGRLQGYRREGRQDVMLLRADVEAIAARIAAGDGPFPAEAKAA